MKKKYTVIIFCIRAPCFIRSRDFRISQSNNTGEESLNTDKILRTLWWKLSRACTCASNSSFAIICQVLEPLKTTNRLHRISNMNSYRKIHVPTLPPQRSWKSMLAANQCLLNKINRVVSLFFILLRRYKLHRPRSCIDLHSLVTFPGRSN